MSDRLVINPPSVCAPAFDYYANGVVCEPGRLLFIAGQVAWDASGNVIGKGDPAAQAEAAITNFRRVVEAAGGTMADVASVTVYVTDMAFAAQISSARTKAFGAAPPTSAIVEVSRLLQPELLVEISGIAVLRSTTTDHRS